MSSFNLRHRVALIAAISRNGFIGKDNGLPWRCPEDLQFFKRTTLGKPVIMGRKTYNSMGNKPLPHRLNIVVSREVTQYNTYNNQVVFIPSIEAALLYADTFAESLADGAVLAPVKEIMVIGGGEIYRQTLPHASRLYLSQIEIDVDGDTRFPEFDQNQWLRHTVAWSKGDEKYPGFRATQYDRRPEKAEPVEGFGSVEFKRVGVISMMSHLLKRIIK